MRYSCLPRTLQAAVGALILAAGLLLAARTSARAADIDVPLYGGEPIVTSGITLGSWGTGVVEEDADVKHDSDRSLKVTTRDFYQGARLDLPRDRQVDLVPILRKENPYLSLTVRLSTTPRAIAVAAPPTAGALGPGGGSSGGSEGGPGGVGGGTTSVLLPHVSKIRVVLVGERHSLEIFSVGDLKPDTEGWTTVGVPLDALAARVQEPSFRIERVLITGNAPDTLYVSRLALVNDNTDVTVKADPEQFNDIRAGAPLKCTATAEAGLTPLKVCWDFDDRDGIQEEAVGTDVKHTFAKPGRYTVTATAMPADSAKKKAVATTFEVEVVP